MPTIEQLGQQVKQTHPGTYDDIDDAKLGGIIQQRYPGAYDDFTGGSQHTPTKIGEGRGDFATGVGKSFINLFSQLSTAGERVLQAPLKLAGLDIDRKTAAEEFIPEELRTPTEAEQAGFTTGEISQFFIPVGAGKAVTLFDNALKFLPKFASKGIALGTAGAAEFGAKTLAQTGDLEEGVKSALLGGVATPAISGAASVVGAGVKKVAPGLGETIASIMSQAIGKEPQHIIQAFKNSQAVAKNMAKKRIPLEVRDDAIRQLNVYRANVGNAFGQGLKQLAKGSPRLGDKVTKLGDSAAIKTGFKDFVESKSSNSLTKTLRKFRISVGAGRTLNFNKLNSSIVKGAEQKNIQQVLDTIKKQSDFSVQGVQDVAARIRALTTFADGQKTSSSAVISAIDKMYDDAIAKFYPELASLRKAFGADMQIIQGIDQVINSVKNEIADPIKATSAVNKLSSIFKEDREAYLNAIKRLEDSTGIDLLNQLAASEFANIAPGSFGSKAMQASLLAGGAIFNPWLLTVLPLFSPKAVGKLTTTAGKTLDIARKVPLADLLKSIPKALAPTLR